MQLYQGCLMVKIDIPQWEEYLKQYINEEDIYIDETKHYIQGLELEPHCTILYGLRNNVNLNKLKKFLIPNHKIKVKFKNISLFENEDYDVVKFDVESTELRLLNQLIKENFQYKSDYDEYWPHVTLSYIKKGLGEKYVKAITPFELIVDKYKFSTIDKEDKPINEEFEIYS